MNKLTTKSNKVAILLLGLFVFTFIAKADPVNILRAKKVALTQIKQMSHNEVSTRSVEDLELVYQAKGNASVPYFYIFNSNNNFVIVSGDDKTLPILGYSNEGTFDPNNIPPNMVYFLKNYEMEIDFTMNNAVPRSNTAKQLWDAFTDEKIDYIDKKQAAPRSQNIHTRAYSPGSYLINTTWSQGVKDYSVILEDPTWSYQGNEGAYNYYCPTIGGLRTVAGCGATSLAQIICYWGRDRKHGLTHGFGSKTYTPNGLGVQTVNFENITLDFNNMPDHIGNINPNPLTKQIKAVAELIYYCGVALNTQFGLDWSSSSIAAIVPAFTNYFGYNAKEQRRSSYDGDWIELLKEEINAERPIIYYGNGIRGGHSFLCDGYDSSNRFHMNWGWGGNANGFFEINSLTPNFVIDFDFTNTHIIIYNIEPKNDAPPVITVYPESVSIPSSETLIVGTGKTLAGTVLPANATDKSLTWTSDNESVVTVDNNGFIYAISPGTAIITVKTVLAEKTATCTVTVATPVSGIYFNISDTTIALSDKPITINVYITPSDATNKEIIWASDNTAVATVSDDGTIIAVSPGTATITATTKDGNFSSSFTLIITTPTGITPFQKVSVRSDHNKIFISTPYQTYVRVYSLNGIQVYYATIPEGKHEISIPEGLYIVVIGDGNSVKVYVK